MSGARGCFNCGGCALSSMSPPSPPFSTFFPSFRHIFRPIYLPWRVLTMMTFFFLPYIPSLPLLVRLQNCGRLSCRCRGRIYSAFCFTHIHRIARKISRPPSSDVPQGRDAHLVIIRLLTSPRCHIPETGA
ncbi:hypothetical protein B0H10DRAFT_1993469, partial [Mycena sp. CBHHK59/15]